MRRSRPITWEEVKVGVLLIVALALLATGIFFIGNTGNVFGDRYQLVTLMRSAAGLVPGAAVQVAGQPVGQVSRIAFIDPEGRPATGEGVAVWLAVNREVRDQIRTDSRARIRTQGLLGDRWRLSTCECLPQAAANVSTKATGSETGPNSAIR